MPAVNVTANEVWDVSTTDLLLELRRTPEYVSNGFYASYRAQRGQ